MFQRVCNLISQNNSRLDDLTWEQREDVLIQLAQEYLQNSSLNTTADRNITLLPPSLNINISVVLSSLDNLFESVVLGYDCIQHEYFEGYSDEESLVKRAINATEFPPIASKCLKQTTVEIKTIH